MNLKKNHIVSNVYTIWFFLCFLETILWCRFFLTHKTSAQEHQGWMAPPRKRSKLFAFSKWKSRNIYKGFGTCKSSNSTYLYFWYLFVYQHILIQNTFSRKYARPDWNYCGSQKFLIKDITSAMIKVNFYFKIVTFIHIFFLKYSQW